MDFTASTFAAENRPFSLPTALSSPLPALLILPLLSCFLTPTIAQRFICLLHSPPSCCRAAILPPTPPVAALFSPHNSPCPSAIFKVERLVFMTLTKEHICSLPVPRCLFSPLLVLSPRRSTCLHTSAADPPHTVFCPFNILQR